MSELFGMLKASTEERASIPHFFDKQCKYHWKGQGRPPSSSLAMLRGCKSVGITPCEGCTEIMCSVRSVDNPGVLCTSPN